MRVDTPQICTMIIVCLALGVALVVVIRVSGAIYDVVAGGALNDILSQFNRRRQRKRQQQWVKQQEAAALLVERHPMRQMGVRPTMPADHLHIPPGWINPQKCDCKSCLASLARKQIRTPNHDCRCEVCLGKPAIPCAVAKAGLSCSVCNNPINDPIHTKSHHSNIPEW